MIQTAQKRIKARLQADDTHPRNSKIQIKYYHCRQQKEKQREQNGAHKQLVQVVVARVDTIPQNVVFATAEKVEQ